MVLCKLPVPGRPTNKSRAGPTWTTVLAAGADGGCLDIFHLLFLTSFSLSLGDGPI